MKYLFSLLISITILQAGFSQSVNPPGWYRFQIPAAEVETYMGIGNASAIAFWLILPSKPAYVNGQDCATCKLPSEWFFHGIGERTTNTATSGKGDTMELDKLKITGHLPWNYSQEGPDWQYNRRYGAPGKLDSFPYAVVAIQCWGNYSYFYKFYPHNVLKFIKKKIREQHPLFSRLDSTRFHGVGLSFGGGAISLIGNDSSIRKQFASLRGLCNGYGSNSGMPYDWESFGKIPTWFEHAVNDPAPPSGQKVDTTDKIVRMINANKPLFAPIYLRYSDGGHSIWTRGFSWVNRVNVYNLTNGDTWSFMRKYPQGYRQWQLQYTTENTKPPSKLNTPIQPYTQ